MQLFSFVLLILFVVFECSEYLFYVPNLVQEEEQTGEVYVPAKLPTLNSDQLAALTMAKKYCQDVTSKYVSIPTARNADSQLILMPHLSPSPQGVSNHGNNWWLKLKLAKRPLMFSSHAFFSIVLR